MTHAKRETEAEIENIVEIVPQTLYFTVVKACSPKRRLKTNADFFFFTIDEELTYQNYYYDFGPLNISCLYKYCMKLNKYLQYVKGMKSVVHYTSNHPDKKANAAFLIGCYCPFRPFLDASQLPCQFTLKLFDCLNAIAKAVAFNFFNFDDFNCSEYDLYDKLEFGDLNWLVPRKFLAFIGPTDNRTSHAPEFYIKYFLKNDVKTVVRLNNVLYDSYTFLQVGIQHYDLIFPDGTTPPKEVLIRFLYISETSPAAIAVHCKAGLGRTGSLIGAYLVKHYRMTAREAIAWLRICRPGCVIGQQQIWLEKIQSWLWRTGSQYRLQHYGEGDKIPRHKYGIYSNIWPAEREKLIKESRRNIQQQLSKMQSDNIVQMKQKSKAFSVDKLINDAKNLKSSGDNFKSVCKLLSPVHCTKRSRDLLSEVKVRKPSKSDKCINCVDPEFITKRVIKKNSKKNMDPHRTTPQPQSHHQKLINSSQGDKLNEIKQRNQKILPTQQKK
ncbi:hypothetical protein GWI33_009150 [Rhynchophorus ferrugineus]|uniref:protein-tyrosine-phosphatase n=1 Tax=Rhynchophorus ferrugineus TaxID=354439 RepID=A0A834IF56_RHYFE|nr:hypothetical protein GWI33_009150 [Rhynchophorus ferrugineus]